MINLSDADASPDNMILQMQRLRESNACHAGHTTMICKNDLKDYGGGGGVACGLNKRGDIYLDTSRGTE